MTSANPNQVREESIWFGPSDRPLFGRLTIPAGDTVLGGVLLAPPIGRESRLARRALRSLAIFLAVDGYASLRFDHYGTGNSSGSMNEGEIDRAWVEGVSEGAVILRSLGPTSLSAAGVRMGATILAAAAGECDLGLVSLAMWDPCESGRAYARELSALGALRRNVIGPETGNSTKMVEFPLSDEALGRLNQFDLRVTSARSPAQRTLIVVRDDRTVSSKFRTSWELQGAEWLTTSEQGEMFETQLADSIQPASTIALIRSWLTAPLATAVTMTVPALARDAVLTSGSDARAVRESVVELGPRKMFGIVSEPAGDVVGPLIVMVNGVNEDHTGPARLWVELSRRWAGLGLRSVRFDQNQLGESPWLPGQPDRPVFDKTRSEDVSDVVRALNMANPADAVLIGYCSGAQLALESALELKTRGVCAISPQVGTGVWMNVDRLDMSAAKSVGSFMRRTENFIERHRWTNKKVRQLSGFAFSFEKFGQLVFNLLKLASAFPPRVKAALAKNDSQALLILSPEDLSPLRHIPVIGFLLRRRLISSESVHIEIVPSLDHAFLSTLGRERAVEILDRHVTENYTSASVTTIDPGVVDPL